MLRSPGLLRFLSFFSLTLASQVMLAAQQIALIPLQIGRWGAASATEWFVMVSVAGLAGVADLGLRLTGHAELIRATRPVPDGAAAADFAGIWTAIRLLTLGLTLLLAVVQPAYAAWLGYAPRPWMAIVAVAAGVEALLIVRCMYSDTLGRYRQAALLYFLFLLVRTIAWLFALLVLDVGPASFATIMLVSALLGLALQEWWLRDAPLLRITAPLVRVRWETLRAARYTLTDPAANWVRINLPVVVLAVFAGPVVTSIYVAMRAVFGLMRQVIAQLARYASAEYALGRESDPAGVTRLASIMITLSVVLAAAGSCAIIVDDGRLLSLWLGPVDPTTLHLIVGSFAIGTAGFSHQIAAAILTRLGEFRAVARRLAAYVAAGAAIGGVAMLGQSLPLYLALLGALEVTLALEFLRDPHGHWGRRVGRLLATATATVMILWFAVGSGRLAGIDDHSLVAVAISIGYWTMAAAALAAGGLMFMRANGFRRRVPG